MIGTKGAFVLVVVNLILASILGVIAGGLLTLALRKQWGIRGALMDALLAALVAVSAATIISVIDNARGVLESRVAVVLAIATGGVVLRHLLRLASPRIR